MSHWNIYHIHRCGIHYLKANNPRLILCLTIVRNHILHCISCIYIYSRDPINQNVAIVLCTVYHDSTPASTRRVTDVVFMSVGHVEITWWNMLKCLVFSTSVFLTSNSCECYFCHVTFMLPGCEISRITLLTKVCYVRNADAEKTRHFNMFYHVISTWQTNINTTSVPRRVFAGTWWFKIHKYIINQKLNTYATGSSTAQAILMAIAFRFLEL